MGAPDHPERRLDPPGRRSDDVVGRELAELTARAGLALSAWEDTRDEVLAALGATRSAVDALASSIDLLASKEDLDAVKSQQDRRAHRTVVALGVLVIALGLVTAAGLALWTVVDGNRETIELLRDCTTPGDHVPTAADPTTGHACYDSGQERTAKVIEQLLDGIDVRIDRALERAGIPPETTTTTEAPR